MIFFIGKQINVNGEEISSKGWNVRGKDVDST